MVAIEFEIDKECGAKPFFDMLAKSMFDLRAGPIAQLMVEQNFLYDLLSELAITAPDGFLTKEGELYTLKLNGYRFEIVSIGTDIFGPVVVVGLPIKITYVSPE